MYCFMSRYIIIIMYVDQYVLFCHDPRLIVTLRHQCAIIHEVDVSKDRFLMIQLTLL